MNKKWRYEDEWFEETNVKLKIVTFLSKSKYEDIRYNRDKMARGPDIEARKGKKRLIIETKGFPSDKYVRGPKLGEKKKAHTSLLAKHWFSEAIHSLLKAKSKDRSCSIGLGLPDKPRYRQLISNVSPVLAILKLKCYLVNEKGKIEIL